MLFFFAQGIDGQEKKTKKITIRNADRIEFDEAMGEGVRILKGNVEFEHEEAIMNCDSAYFYSNDNKVDAFSNIHIHQGDTLHLYGDFLKYMGNKKLAQVRDNVKLIDKEAYLITEYLDYDLEKDMGYYFNGGEIINDENRLESIKGYYYTETYNSFFKDSVKITNPDYIIYSDTIRYNTQSKIAYFLGPTEIISDSNYIYCENGWYDTEKDISQFNEDAYLTSEEYIVKGDSLYYDRIKGYGKAFDYVNIKDTSSNIILQGHYAEFFEFEDRAYMTDSAVFIQVDDQNDSLFLHGDTLKLLPDTVDNKMVLAYYNVKFYKTDFQGLCDSMIYYEADSTIDLYYSPVLWSQEQQITAEHIKIFTNESGVDYMEATSNSFIIMQEDTSRYNQIKGRNMMIYFRDNKLHKIDVNGNGQTIYYAKDNEDLVGLNKTESSNLTIYSKNNKIDRILFLEKVQATMYPIEDTPENMKFLKDFEWLEEYRPKNKLDIFNKQ
jgi:lipopolysaccharide export system protein LptA